MRAQTAVAFLLTAVASAALGAIGMRYLARSETDKAGQTFHVREIDSYGEVDGNLLVILEVFLEGRTGHVTNVKCLLPPDTKLVLKNNPNSDNIYEREFPTFFLTDVHRIEVTKAAQEIEPDLFFCRIQEASA